MKLAITMRCAGLLTAIMMGNANAGDIAAQLDTTNGLSEFVVYDAATNPLFRVLSDGPVVAEGQVSADSFVGSGAGLTELSGGALMAGTVSNVHLAAGAVESDHIADGALRTNHFGPGSVTSGAIGLGAVTSLQIANGSVAAQDLAKTYYSGRVALDTLIPTNSIAFAGYATNLAVEFPLAFDATPIVTLAIETAADYEWPANLHLRSATTTNFIARLTVPSMADSIDATSTHVNQYITMALINGRPAMAYRGGESGSFDLYYIRASNTIGTAWGAPIAIYTNDYISYCSLAEVDGAPAIAFYDSASDNMLYVRATDADGDTWGPVVTVWTNGNSGQFASLAVINGNPAISFLYTTSNELLYARATDSQGSAWATPVRAATNAGSYGTSLLEVNGNPAIAYCSEDNELMFVRGNDTSGFTWQTPVIASTNAGWYASMAIVQTNPAIAFSGTSDYDLFYVRSSNVNGTAWFETEVVDTNGYAGLYPHLAVLSNYPAITYIETGDDVLKYHRASSIYGFSWSGNPVSVYTNDNAVGVGGLLAVEGSPAIGFNSDAGSHYIRSGNVPPASYLNWVAVEP